MKIFCLLFSRTSFLRLELRLILMSATLDSELFWQGSDNSCSRCFGKYGLQVNSIQSD
ncbi:hypothetical protein RchiOBHm_Chr5g0076931 [Rosa chinensis]|uniref:Uncharacterized protein n=1 Tax=Rosa chinensis TaxID=74649 RepID=A0A2P6QLX1_ROSCH|nr:hypothetical protein RchiOBHm_Chr5g0076931 [Rosa chinensis]